MFITKVKKFRQDADGRYTGYTYYRLSRSYRDSQGRGRKEHVLCLGELPGLTKRDRDELADMLTEMIERGQSVMSDRPWLQDLAMGFYVKYRESRYALENDPVLMSEAARKERERRERMIRVSLDSLRQRHARTVGPEAVCRSTSQVLHIREFLNGKGWPRWQVDLALMQTVARAIYPYSELKTVRYLRDNSALLEMFKLQRERVTKDALYQSALRLWEVHVEMEDFLHERVRSMFGLEERILLFDLTNTYFEGRMDGSQICQRGHSKEKRDDCKIVALAAVVNTDGLLVRTRLFEGNRQDVTTLEEVVGSLAGQTSPEARKVVVMDAGFYSADNVRWLTEQHFDYITVMPTGEARFTPTDGKIVTCYDRRKQPIRLQRGKAESKGVYYNALLVDSDSKALKEQAMYEQARLRYEQGLEAIKAGLEKKGGTKGRDAVNKRLGRLNQKYGAIHRSYEVKFTYQGKGKKETVVDMSWTANDGYVAHKISLHGKYVLVTNLDVTDETNVWKLYNVIRTVEETFHVLKTDLDIRPVFHKKDAGIKAHINLAVLAYWIVSVTMHRLKLKQYHNVRWDEIMRVAQAQVVVTAELETESGETVRVRQSTEAESELATIYRLLNICPHPIGKIKSVVHPKQPQKKRPLTAKHLHTP